MFFSHIPGHSFTQGRISQISRCNLEDISFLQGGGKLANNILFRALSSCKSWSESKDTSHNKVLRFACFTGEKSIAFQNGVSRASNSGLIFDTDRTEQKG